MCQSRLGQRNSIHKLEVFAQGNVDQHLCHETSLVRAVDFAEVRPMSIASRSCPLEPEAVNLTLLPKCAT